MLQQSSPSGYPSSTDATASMPLTSFGLPSNAGRRLSAPLAPAQVVSVPVSRQASVGMTAPTTAPAVRQAEVYAGAAPGNVVSTGSSTQQAPKATTMRRVSAPPMPNQIPNQTPPTPQAFASSSTSATPILSGTAAAPWNSSMRPVMGVTTPQVFAASMSKQISLDGSGTFSAAPSASPGLQGQLQQDEVIAGATSENLAASLEGESELEDSSSAKLMLTAFFHSSMEVPFSFAIDDLKLYIKGSSDIAALISALEAKFREVSERSGEQAELQINLLWNAEDDSKALDPRSQIDKHFADGGSFGIYGDIMPPAAPSIDFHRASPSKDTPERPKIPITVLTGFLGAGKTTLLNYILQEQTDMKIAVIENEFGEVSIDDILLKQGKLNTVETIVTLDNGCMCCNVRGDLRNGLLQILSEVESGITIDGVIIETTGMADPVPVLKTFRSLQELEDGYRLDCVVTVVDAKHLPGRLSDKIEKGKVNEALQQVTFADRVLLNKLDLVTVDEAIAVKNRVRAINAFARVLPCMRGRVMLSDIINVHAHTLHQFEEGGKSSLNLKGAFSRVPESLHDSNVRSFSFVHAGEVPPMQFLKYIGFLMDKTPKRGIIFRVKADRKSVV